MRRYIPGFILDHAQAEERAGSLAAHTMFIDISGFTAMTHALMKNGKEGAEVLSEVINRVFTPAIDAIYVNGGFVATFAGDAFTAVFPADRTPAASCLLAARQIQAAFLRDGLQQTRFGSFHLTVKIGLSGGEVRWGILENPTQNAFYFRGAAIDGAAAGEPRSGTGEIVCPGHYLDDIPPEHRTPRNDTHWLLLPVADLPPLTAPPMPPEEDYGAFVPRAVLNLTSRGEFREIVSCFLSFAETPDFAGHMADVITLAGEFGGYFNKIDFGDKGGVALILFGAPIGRERLQERALAFALAVQDIPGFTMRMGITYGTCFTGIVGSERRCEYTAIGMVVNLSARFMMKAQWGDIYTDRFIHKSEHERFRIDFLAEQMFKGFAEPIPVYLLHERREDNREVSFDGPLAGRTHELTRLREALAPLREGRFGGIVYVDGAAGIGKSRLLWQLRRELNPESFSWFHRPCAEVLRKSFNPLEHWLRLYFQLSDQADGAANRCRFENTLYVLIQSTIDLELRAELARTQSLLGALVGLHWPDSLYERLDARSRYENTLDALKTLIKAESRQRPVVLEFDDALWMDEDTRAFLAALCRHVSDYPILMFVASRYQDDGSPLNLNLGCTPAQRVRLAELDADAGRALLTARLRLALEDKTAELPDSTFHLVWGKSEGNPFFMEQILLFLQENGHLNERHEPLHRDVEIPSQINAIIIARIDRLADEIKETIKTASVLGKEFLLSILTEMLRSLDIPFDMQHLDQVIEEGETENIWNPVHEIRYIFKHALVRESVYEIQLRHRLRQLHRLAAETIERLYESDLRPHYADLAWHYDTAEVVSKAIAYMRLAGLEAKHDFLNQQALHFFSRHIELLLSRLGVQMDELAGFHPDEDDREDTAALFDALLERKYLLQLTGDNAAAEQTALAALALAGSLADDERLGKAHLDLANLRRTQGSYDEAMSALQQAQLLFEHTGNRQMTGLVHLDRGVTLFYQGRQTEAFEDFQRELEIFEALGDKPRIAEALGNLAVLYRFGGEPEKSMSFLRRQLIIATEIDDKIQIARVQSNIGWVFEGQGDSEQALSFYEKSLAGNRELGLKAEIVRLLDNIGYANQQLNRHAKALEYHRAAFEMAAESGDADSMTNITLNIGHVHKALADLDAADRQYNEAADMIKRWNLRYALPELLIERADLRLRQGRPAEARTLCDEGLRVAEEIGSAEFISKGRALMEKLS